MKIKLCVLLLILVMIPTPEAELVVSDVADTVSSDIIEIEPVENSSLPYLELSNDTVQRGSSLNIILGMYDANQSKYVAGYKYELKLFAPVGNISLLNSTTINSTRQFELPTFDPLNPDLFSPGNYSISLLVNSTNRGLLTTTSNFTIVINPNADVRFSIFHDGSGFSVNRTEDFFITITNIGGGNAFEVEVSIQSIEPPIGLQHSIFPFYVDVLESSKLIRLDFTMTPSRYGIGSLTFRTSFKDGAGVTKDGILLATAEILPTIDVDLSIENNLAIGNTTRVQLEILNPDEANMELHITLQSDKILFATREILLILTDSKAEQKILGSVEGNGWGYILVDILYKDTDGFGEAIIFKRSYSVFINSDIVEIANKSNLSTLVIILISLIILLLLLIGVTLFLYYNPQVRRKIAKRLSPSTFNKSISYPTNKIIIDGSNVAWDEPTSEGKANIDNLLTAIEELKKAGFTEIKAIVDAALRYQVENREKFDSLARKGVFKVLPAKVSADHFILRLSQETDSLILTNDLFREFIEDFPWINERRVPFSIMDHEFFLHPIAGEYSNFLKADL